MMFVMQAHFIAAVALSLGAACGLAAQTPRSDPPANMHGMAGMHHMGATTASPIARQQIDHVARDLADLGSPEAAAGAGYHPALGWIPTMGVHWVDSDRMTKLVETDRQNPSQLMFSKISGKDSLVGAAYAYYTSSHDTAPPPLFDGAPAWHDHPDLAPPGMNLVMLHVWFVPSPDGPFAGTNPNLPFWALGLVPPDARRMHDPAFSMLVRRAALALAEVADTTSIFPNLERQPGVRPVLAARRDSIRAILPAFRAADEVGSRERWRRAATRAAAQWDGIYAAYLASARTPTVRSQLQRYVAMLLGQHHE